MSFAEAEAPVLVIGFGNELRGDDAAGVVAARLLEGVFPERDVRVMTYHQLMPELTEPISEAELVIFIDASVEHAAGEVAWRELTGSADAEVRDSHSLTPAQVLACAKLLYGRCAEAKMVCIGGEDFELKEGLSAPVQAAVARAAGEIRACVEKFLAGRGRI